MVDMRYETREFPDHRGHPSLDPKKVCVFTADDGTEWEFRYKTISEFSRIMHSAPAEVREYIIHWAKMLDNPD